MTARQAAWGIAVITIVAAGLRLFRIDAQSAWLDEAFTIHAAAGSWSEMMRILVDDFNHPPLHTVLVRWWFDLAGHSVLNARLLSAVFGTLAVPALYWLGTLLFDRRTGLIASFLLAISQLAVIYSQEARAYSLLLLLVILATAFFIRHLQTGRVRDFVWFVVVVTLLIYTHYYSIFAIAALMLYGLMFHRRAIPASRWAAALAVTTVAYLPWLMSGVVQSAMRNPDNARVAGLSAGLTSPLYALNWFNNGKISGIREQAPLWAFAVGCLVFTAPALWALWRRAPERKREPGAEVLLALCLLIPIGAVTALGFLRVIYDVRHVSFALAAYYLLVARGITLVSPKALRAALMVAIVGYWSASLRSTYFVPFKENYRDAFATLVSQAAAGDCTVYGAPNRRSFAGWYWTSYYPHDEPPTLLALDQAASRSDCRRIWLLWDRSFWNAGPLTIDQAAAAIGPAYAAAQRWSFLSVDLQLFAQRQD